jgi:3-hydroxyacyl-CoA dehydrogenase/3a,7a,12a-trihydroxy-5b-cholest-24-enoyl-CoA hydratase
MRGAAGGGASSAAAAAPSGEPTSAEAFAVIKDYIEKNPAMAAEIGKTFLFRLSEPESAWTLDLKNGKGGVTAGGDKGDCTLDLSDADFCAMVAGKADPMKLWTEKKLKIGGDIMASQKLMFLKKIDPKEAAGVVAKMRGAAAAAPAAGGAAPAPAKGAAKSAHAPEVFKALAARLAEKPALAKEVGAVVKVVVVDQNRDWTIDLKSATPSVAEGDTKQPDITLSLDDEALRALATDGNMRDHFQRGQVRVDGDARIASKLNFFKGLV